jgi:hypothetical protein
MRPLLAALTTLLTLAALAVPATAVAATCELTTAVEAGHSITVTGTGFAASSTIDITTDRSGSNAINGGTGPQTTKSQETSDASGRFVHVIDAGPGHGGTYEVSATDGTCTATTQAAAVETAGGVNPGGGTAGQTLPPTDTAAPAGRPAVSSVGAVAPVLLLGFGVGLIALGTRVRRVRRSTLDREAARRV